MLASAAVGVLTGLVIDNIGLGIGIGLALGIALAYIDRSNGGTK